MYIIHLQALQRSLYHLKANTLTVNSRSNFIIIMITTEITMMNNNTCRSTTNVTIQQMPGHNKAGRKPHQTTFTMYTAHFSCTRNNLPSSRTKHSETNQLAGCRRSLIFCRSSMQSRCGNMVFACFIK